MRRYSLSLLAGCCLLAVGSASAGEVRLSDEQLDDVTAGFLGVLGPRDFVGGLFDGLFGRQPEPAGDDIVIGPDGIPVAVNTDTEIVNNPDGSQTTITNQDSVIEGRLNRTIISTRFGESFSGSAGMSSSGGISSSLFGQ